ncbi:MAG TPA: hypothetical protein VMV59_04615 [Candidatus Dormibacteraeota bacterium]|nr:hypothetical protein [Candidatus Dormibacteraeota bacterium]
MKTGLKQVATLFAIAVFSSALFAQEAKAPLITIPEGTQISARLADDVDSGQVHVGDHISMNVLEDLKIQGATVIQKGAIVMGRVTQAKGARKMGRGGKLDISFQTLTAADGTKVPISGILFAKGKGGYGGGSAVGAVGAGLLFPPAAALLLLKHGHASVIPAGAILTLRVTAATSVAALPVVAAPIVQAPVIQTQCRALVSGENNFLAPDETYVPASSTRGPAACRQVKVISQKTASR